MPNVPPKRDANRPKPRAARGAKARPASTPATDASRNDGARRDRAAARQDERRGGLGELAHGGYADQEPKPGRR